MTLSPAISRIAAVALLVAAMWLAWAGLAAPLLDGVAQDRDSIARSRQLAARYAQFSTLIPDLQKRLEMQRAASAGAKDFLTGANPALRAAELQASVQRLTKSAELGLRSSNSLPPTTEAGFEQVGLDLELTASASGLQHLLYDLETAEPAMFIDRLSVRVPENGAAAVAADGQPGLSVSLRVLAYAPAGGKAP